MWTVDNMTDWSHPLHLHGFFFMVRDERGEPVRPYEWKDTVDVPFKQAVRMVVRFDENRPGVLVRVAIGNLLRVGSARSELRVNGNSCRRGP